MKIRDIKKMRRPIIVRLDDELYKLFRIYCIKVNQSMQSVIYNYIKNLVKDRR